MFYYLIRWEIKTRDNCWFSDNFPGLFFLVVLQTRTCISDDVFRECWRIVLWRDARVDLYRAFPNACIQSEFGATYKAAPEIP